MCGGTRPAGVLHAAHHGLSPRVRGNLYQSVAGWQRWRSIPACAGEPPIAGGLSGLAEVYPRVCGGTGRFVPLAQCLQGLSPRVRGNPTWFTAQRKMDRSIPACAGEPRRAATSIPANRVYPRVCGGTSDSPPQPSMCKGLSPRVRGNPRRISPASCASRSIPACAGEPRPALCGQGPRKVYPRVCGGTRLRPHQPAPPNGLSPRVRGNPGRPISV